MVFIQISDVIVTAVFSCRRLFFYLTERYFMTVTVRTFIARFRRLQKKNSQSRQLGEIYCRM